MWFEKRYNNVVTAFVKYIISYFACRRNPPHTEFTPLSVGPSHNIIQCDSAGKATAV